MAPTLVSQTHTLLQHLSASPYPDLESPEATKRRASVAFIIRIKPSYSHWPTSSEKIHDLDTFYAQDWVQHGDPEVLFIKRASRKGDRWTSHVALPGGKRDPEDADDQAAAIRESWEEVGLDVQAHAISCGNLPQRLVTTHWGKKPLMVLCPYVFLLTTPHIPPLRLQPTEVAATHWVPLRSLQSPSQRTVAFEDVSSRLANQETGVKKWMLSLILGKMMFAAINLLPTESLHSAETPAPDTGVQLQDNRHVQEPSPLSVPGLRNLFSQLTNPDPNPPKQDSPLLLWGLTLGVISDFLDLIPPHNALELWTYPTFSPLDVRFVVWLMTYRFKQRKRAELQAGTAVPSSSSTSTSTTGTNTATPTQEAGTGTRRMNLHRPSFGGVTESLANSAVMVPSRPDETGLHGLGTGSSPPPPPPPPPPQSTIPPHNSPNPSSTRESGPLTNPSSAATDPRKAAVSTMLEGYVAPPPSSSSSSSPPAPAPPDGDLRPLSLLVRALLPAIDSRARYYDIVRRAVGIALLGRAAAVLGVVVWVLRQRRRGTGMVGGG
ncbi:hypothetical protein KC332_g6593 [Hortaea werneckii]|uniref:Nudix hydrolase domain-containing protein n=1 Tax=Hortaea werneckii TaxID=91943 RepID=A0A3M7GWZ7_HORWE|nr:hypothetical protein KC358_g6320 [Hortaea werneckii]KAI6841640.1 hypothetical protein KC350_g5186 [Hortaea werneckii]KAI6933840.1 hypothetical protein KC348_g6649 [Hortaea werneckii]KAI6936571.1 hypothetical protein KC341_g6162 [Hortaea werneckii]KAI6971891.1 hypothetical protein KC321_g6528 [Hortaea werneckii]